MSEYLYILCNDWYPDNVYKFGYTKNINRRKYDSCFTTGFVSPCYYVKYFKCELTEKYSIRSLESKINKLLQPYHKPDTVGQEIYHIEIGSLLDIIINTLRKYNISYKMKNDYIDKNYKPTLYLNQRGAGCGKTYESIQLLGEEKFAHKNVFIYLSKLHSAKTVIMEELRAQIHSEKLEADDFESFQYYKQKVNYITVDSNEKIAIIGTIDSFMWSVGNHEHKEHKDIFKNLVDSILAKGYNAQKKINYAGKKLNFNERVLVIIDEVQDLRPEYVTSLMNIMRTNKIDLYLIGDKLQSIWGENMIYSYVEKKYPDILERKKIVDDGIIINYDIGHNIVRRFHNNDLKLFVNKVIDFEKYELGRIKSICPGGCSYHHNDYDTYGIEKCVDLFKVESNYEERLSHSFEEECGIIGHKMKQLIKKYKYKPNDFLFIFPVLKNNPFANTLEIFLENFWKEFYRDPNKEKDNPYVVLHKSTDKGSIDLDKSKKSTRIISIHTSKGQGRNVVFALDLTERNLLKFSKEKNLQYESLLHVALTRQKQFLIIGHSNIPDDITRRIVQFTGEELSCNGIMYQSDTFSLRSMLNYYENNKKFYKTFGEVIDQITYEEKKNVILSNKNGVIDWDDKCVRYYCMLYYTMINLLDDSDEKAQQFYTVINNIFHTKLPNDVKKRDYTSGDFRKKYVVEKNYINYQNYIRKRKAEKEGNFPKSYFENHGKIPVLDFTIGTNYIDNKFNYPKELNYILRKLAGKLRNFKAYKNKLCPLETLVLMYYYELYMKGAYSDISILQVYTIMNSYKTSYNTRIYKEHEKLKCGCCKTLFNGKTNGTQTKEKYILHQEMLQNLEDCIKIYKEKYHMNRYNLFLNPRYDTVDLKFKTDLFISGYSEKHCVNIVIVPEISDLNKYDTIVNAIFQQFIIMNQKESEQKTFINYNNKPCDVVIFTLNTKPIMISCELCDSALKIQMNKYIKSYIRNTYLDYSSHLYDLNMEYIEKKSCIEKSNKPPVLELIFYQIRDERITNRKEFYEKYKNIVNTKLNNIIFLNIEEKLNKTKTS